MQITKKPAEANITKIRCTTIGCNELLLIHYKEKDSILTTSLYCPKCGEVKDWRIKPITTKHLGKTQLIELRGNGPANCQICGQEAFFFINYKNRPIKFVGDTACCYSLECYIAYLQKLEKEASNKL